MLTDSLEAVVVIKEVDMEVDKEVDKKLKNEYKP